MWRSVRHQLEKEGLPTVHEEFPISIGGVQFTGAILQEHLPSGQTYYRGMFSIFRNGYILSFDAEAMLDWDSDQIISTQSQINSSQLSSNRVPDRHPFVVGV